MSNLADKTLRLMNQSDKTLEFLDKFLDTPTRDGTFKCSDYTLLRIKARNLRNQILEEKDNPNG